MEAGTDAVSVHGFSLTECALLGEQRKEGDEGGRVGPESAAVLHAEEALQRVLVHAVERVAGEHGVLGDGVPGGHGVEDGGGGAEAGALHVEVDEGGGDEEIGAEARAGGLAVDGAAGAEVEQRGAGLEDEGEGVLVGRAAGVAEHGGVEVQRAGGVGGAAPGVDPDERVVGARVRVRDSVEQVAGEREVAPGDVGLQLQLLLLEVACVGGRCGGGEEAGGRRTRRAVW